MRTAPLLAVLDSGVSLGEVQAALSAALGAWRADPICASVRADLEAYGAGGAFGDCAALVQIMSDTREALGFVDGLIGRVLPLLATHPLGQFPLQHQWDERGGCILLERAERAMLLLALSEPGARRHTAASFGASERRDLVLAGHGMGLVVRRETPTKAQARALGPGAVMTLEPGCGTLLTGQVERRLVSLRLVRMAQTPGPVEEFSLADGSLVGRSAGSAAESRRELALAVLGAMGRADAAPAMAEFALGDDTAQLRWQALRQCLVLDGTLGFASLCRIAGCAEDPLATHAAVLKERLCVQHPHLGRLEFA